MFFGLCARTAHGRVRLEFSSLCLITQRALVGVAAFVCAASAMAGVNTFTSLGPEGGVIVQATYHPLNPALAYAAAPSGFYRSADSGQTWDLISDLLGGPSAFAVDPTNAERVFVSYQSNGLFSFTQSGGLRQVSTFPLPQALSGPVAAASDGTIYVATASHVFWTSNLGVSWNQSSAVPPTDTAIRVLRVDPIDPATIYVVSQGKNIFRSVDRGANWTIVTPPDQASLVSYVDDLEIVGSSPRRLWIATNYGLWTRLDNEATWTNRAPVNGPYRTLTGDPSNSFLYATNANDGLFLSEDNGLTWDNIQNGAFTGTVTTLAISPTDSDQLMMGGFEGLMASSDRGLSWEFRNTGIVAPRTETVVASPSSDRIYVQTTYNGIFEVDAAAGAIAPLNTDQLRSFVSNPLLFTTRGLAVDAGAGDELMTVLSRGIARSMDGGASWQFHTSLELQSAGLQSIATARSQGADVFLAAGSSELYRSTDAGVSWSGVAGLDSYISLNLVSPAPSNPSRVYMAAAAAPTSQSVLRSDDAGATWQATSPIPTGYLLTIAVDPSDDDVVYAAVVPTGLLKSVDGGTTWTALAWDTESYTPWAVTVDPQNSNIIYASGGGAIRRSVDAGATWESLPTPDFPSSWDVRSLAVDPNRPHQLYAAAQDDGLRMISIQPDLALASTSSPTLVSHGAITRFSYVAKNEGVFAATNVVAAIALTGDISQVEASMAGGSCVTSTTSVTCTRPVLKANESSIISLNVVYASAGDATVSANLSGDQPDPAATNNAKQAAVQVQDLLSDLSIEWSGTATLTAGNPASYTVTVRNSGPQQASDVSVVIALANTLSAVSAVPSTGSCVVSSGAPIQCTIPMISAQQSVTIAIASSPVSVGSYTNSASVSANGVDSVAGNNEATFISNVSAATTPPPSGGGQNNGGGSGGGGGGGGSGSWLILALLTLLRFEHARRARLMAP